MEHFDRDDQASGAFFLQENAFHAGEGAELDFDLVTGLQIGPRGSAAVASN